MTSRRRRVWIVVGIVVVAITLAEFGMYRVSDMSSITYPNSAWQLSGDRVAFTGDVLFDVQCTTDNAPCREIRDGTGKDPASKATITARMKLSIDDPPWCYTPLYKRGELSYHAEVDIADSSNGRHKQIGLQGLIEASAIGLDSCGNLRTYLLHMAARDLRVQLAKALELGDKMMWKCSDGMLRISAAPNPCLDPKL